MSWKKYEVHYYNYVAQEHQVRLIEAVHKGDVEEIFKYHFKHIYDKGGIEYICEVQEPVYYSYPDYISIEDIRTVNCQICDEEIRVDYSLVESTKHCDDCKEYIERDLRNENS